MLTRWKMLTFQDWITCLFLELIRIKNHRITIWWWKKLACLGPVPSCPKQIPQRTWAAYCPIMGLLLHRGQEEGAEGPNVDKKEGKEEEEACPLHNHPWGEGQEDLGLVGSKKGQDVGWALKPLLGRAPARQWGISQAGRVDLRSNPFLPPFQTRDQPCVLHIFWGQGHATHADGQLGLIPQVEHVFWLLLIPSLAIWWFWEIARTIQLQHLFESQTLLLCNMGFSFLLWNFFLKSAGWCILPEMQKCLGGWGDAWRW